MEPVSQLVAGGEASGGLQVADLGAIPINRSKVLLAILATVVLAIGVSMLAWLARPRPAFPPTPTADESRYLGEIEVTDARLSAMDNFLGNTVINLDARLANRRPRTVRRVRLQVEFMDLTNQVVLRETREPVNERTAPLRAGETRAFRASFDNVPADWNHLPPRIMPVFVEF